MTELRFTMRALRERNYAALLRLLQRCVPSDIAPMGSEQDTLLAPNVTKVVMRLLVKLQKLEEKESTRQGGGDAATPYACVDCGIILSELHAFFDAHARAVATAAPGSELIDPAVPEAAMGVLRDLVRYKGAALLRDVSASIPGDAALRRFMAGLLGGRGAAPAAAAAGGVARSPLATRQATSPVRLTGEPLRVAPAAPPPVPGAVPTVSPISVRSGSAFVGLRGGGGGGATPPGVPTVSPPGKEDVAVAAAGAACGDPTQQVEELFAMLMDPSKDGTLHDVRARACRSRCAEGSRNRCARRARACFDAGCQPALRGDRRAPRGEAAGRCASAGVQPVLPDVHREPLPKATRV